MPTLYRLGILSDTHLTDLKSALALAEGLIASHFAEVDAILHAGDMILPELELCFGEIPVYSVRGNMDEARTELPVKRIIEIGGYRIGLIHGWGPPAQVPANALSAFADMATDLIVFGHSHTPFCRYFGQTMLFNPGSATEHRNRAASCTVGLIELGSELTARHMRL